MRVILFAVVLYLERQWWTRLQATCRCCHCQRSVNDFISWKEDVCSSIAYSPTLRRWAGAERKWGVCVQHASPVCVCVCVNGMHKSGTKQAATWHTDLLLGTFTARTDVTDWTVCRCSLVSPHFLSFSQQKKKKPKMTKKITQKEESRNIKFLRPFSSSTLLLSLEETAPNKKNRIINKGFPSLSLWWFGFRCNEFFQRKNCFSKWRHLTLFDGDSKNETLECLRSEQKVFVETYPAFLKII